MVILGGWVFLMSEVPLYSGGGGASQQWREDGARRTEERLW